MRTLIRGGFSLVELLVVVTIIVVLLALLTPALDTAIREAELAVCSSNQRSIGQALQMYLGDSRRYYPVLNVWAGLLGRPTAAEVAPPTLNTATTVRGRPLNPYLGYPLDDIRGEMPVARCPSDQGDFLVPAQPKAYPRTGTSYLAAFTPHPTKLEPKGYAGVKFVFGYSGFYGTDPRYGQVFITQGDPTAPAKQTSLPRLDNKMLVADFPWHMNRETASLKTRWHRPDDPRRLINTLFDDTHVELLDWRADIFDPTVREDRNPNAAQIQRYDHSWKWW